MGFPHKQRANVHQWTQCLCVKTNTSMQRPKQNHLPSLWHAARPWERCRRFNGRAQCAHCPAIEEKKNNLTSCLTAHPSVTQAAYPTPLIFLLETFVSLYVPQPAVLVRWRPNVLENKENQQESHCQILAFVWLVLDNQGEGWWIGPNCRTQRKDNRIENEKTEWKIYIYEKNYICIWIGLSFQATVARWQTQDGESKWKTQTLCQCTWKNSLLTY